MISKVRLQNFRSHEDFSFEPSKTTTAIVGPNGSGKTNILEAVHTVLVGKSFRADDPALVREGAEWSRVDLELASGDKLSMTLDLRAGTLLKKFSKNDQPSEKPFWQLQPVVLFEPEQLRILHGPPELRRSFVDSLVTATNPQHPDTIKRYARALRQRNALLKQPKARSDAFFVWDIKLSEYGSRIVAARQAVINDINKSITASYQKISATDDSIRLSYETKGPDEDYASWLTAELASRRTTDQYRGFTSVGPHREDLCIWYNDSPATIRTSRGETRSIMLALKEYELSLYDNPLVLYDDVTSELDSYRSNHIQLSNQMILTATDTIELAIEKTYPLATPPSK